MSDDGRPLAMSGPRWNVPPVIEPDDHDDALAWAYGVVRGVTQGVCVTGPYARIRLAGDRDYLMDFDDPEQWQELRGREVRVLFADQTGRDGQQYRLVLDVAARSR